MKKFNLSDKIRPEHGFWLVPPEIYDPLNKEFKFDFDPCPNPRPKDFDGLTCDWGKSNWVNPPFWGGITAWVRKAMLEQKKGNSSVIILPLDNWVKLLLDSGAKIEVVGSHEWIHSKDGSRRKAPRPSFLFKLAGKHLTHSPSSQERSGETPEEDTPDVSGILDNNRNKSSGTHSQQENTQTEVQGDTQAGTSDNSIDKEHRPPIIPITDKKCGHSDAIHKKYGYGYECGSDNTACANCGHSEESHIHYGFDGSRHSLTCKGCKCKKFTTDDRTSIKNISCY